jgi:DNA helicase HerA-like ATPase
LNEADGGYSILQVHNLRYGSQIPETNLEMISGMKLEGFRAELDFMEPALRNYILATVKTIAKIKDNKAYLTKTLPNFMSNARLIKKSDLDFLEAPENPKYFGDVRSGSKLLDVQVNLNDLMFLLTIYLIPATTGRGKKQSLKVLLWESQNKDKCGILVLDPHDE